MSSPLAERMRPKSLQEFLGQNNIIGPDSLLFRSLKNGKLPSLLFWGPPGCGKTTLASLLHKEINLPYTSLSAVQSGIKDVKAVLQAATLRFQDFQEQTLLFIDEIHRFNKSQQDSLLKAVEEGPIILIGATTENPSFEVNKALLSRCHLLVFETLSQDNLITIAKEAIKNGLKRPDLIINTEVLKFLASQCSGDARFLLNQLEWLVESLSPNQKEVSLEDLKDHKWQKPLAYDKEGEEHYNLISVLHKSIRGSDPDASIYWLHRMLQAGAQPRYLFRRLIRIAMEDIGLADPQALPQAVAAQQAFEFLGSPEGLLGLDQLVLYLATAPKSNQVEMSHFAARDLVKRTGNLKVPEPYKNAPTQTMKNLGYGKGYKYDHDSPQAYSGQDHFPENLSNTKLYNPTPYGFEKDIQKRILWWETLKKTRNP